MPGLLKQRRHDDGEGEECETRDDEGRVMGH